jgi:hypothetical protein
MRYYSTSSLDIEVIYELVEKNGDKQGYHIQVNY